mgnify:CR=1 FL=1
MIIEHRDEVVLAIGSDGPAVVEAAERWLASAGFTVTRPAPDRIEFRRGSQAKLRLLGGAFIAATSLPVTGSVTVRAAAGGPVADVVVSDDVRIGSRLFMRQKYERLVTETGAVLAGVLTDTTPA